MRPSWPNSWPVVARWRPPGRPIESIRLANVPLPVTAPRLAAIQRDLEEGTGLVDLRGLPIADTTPEILRAILWAIGLHLGTALSTQSKLGELLGRVRDTGESSASPAAGATAPVAACAFTPTAAMWWRCSAAGNRRPAASLIVSTPAIHNAMLEQAPHLLDLLFQPWFHSRQQEQQAGQSPWSRNPIFALHQGRFTNQYSRSYVRSAQRYEVPRLTADQVAAIDLLGRLANDLALQTRMEPGDIQLLNNHITYHARTELLDPQRLRPGLSALAFPAEQPCPCQRISMSFGGRSARAPCAAAWLPPRGIAAHPGYRRLKLQPAVTPATRITSRQRATSAATKAAYWAAEEARSRAQPQRLDLPLRLGLLHHVTQRRVQPRHDGRRDPRAATEAEPGCRHEFGKPCSAKVGTSGKLGKRVAEATARTRRLPARTSTAWAAGCPPPHRCCAPSDPTAPAPSRDTAHAASRCRGGDRPARPSGAPDCPCRPGQSSSARPRPWRPRRIPRASRRAHWH